MLGIESQRYKTKRDYQKNISHSHTPSIYHLIYQMKQKLIKIIWIILVLIVVIILISTWGTAAAINPNSEKIAELSFQLNELESQKYKCLDDLTRKQSQDQFNWFTKYCVEYDEQIMWIEAEIDSLKEWKAESETETAWTAELREPWMLNESGDAQLMPEIVADTEHEKFKKLAEAYWLDAGQIWNVENHYWIKEWVVLCITVAETSWGNRWAWGKNIGSVGSNDRGNRPTYALMESWLEDIGKTLTNRYLGKIQTLGCLSNAGSCQSRDDNWKRYATSDWNWQRNMVACLSTIYGTINPSTFSIRR